MFTDDKYCNIDRVVVQFYFIDKCLCISSTKSPVRTACCLVKMMMHQSIKPMNKSDRTKALSN